MCGRLGWEVDGRIGVEGKGKRDMGKEWEGGYGAGVGGAGVGVVEACGASEAWEVWRVCWGRRGRSEGQAWKGGREEKVWEGRGAGMVNNRSTLPGSSC